MSGAPPPSSHLPPPFPDPEQSVDLESGLPVALSAMQKKHSSYASLLGCIAASMRLFLWMKTVQLSLQVSGTALECAHLLFERTRVYAVYAYSRCQVRRIDWTRGGLDLLGSCLQSLVWEVSMPLMMIYRWPLGWWVIYHERANTSIVY